MTNSSLAKNNSDLLVAVLGALGVMVILLGLFFYNEKNNFFQSFAQSLVADFFKTNSPTVTPAVTVNPAIDSATGQPTISSDNLEVEVEPITTSQ